MSLRRERGTVSATLSFVNSVNPFFDKIQVNGDDRARTDNLRLARAALSQLSYVPLRVAMQTLLATTNGRGRTRTSDLSFIRAAI